MNHREIYKSNTAQLTDWLTQMRERLSRDNPELAGMIEIHNNVRDLRTEVQWLVDELDEGDAEDRYGTEGWRHRYGEED